MVDSVNSGSGSNTGQRASLNPNTFSNANGTFTSPGPYGPIVRVPDWEANLVSGLFGRRRPAPAAAAPGAVAPTVNTVLPGRGPAPAAATPTPQAPAAGNNAFAALLAMLLGGGNNGNV